MNSELFQRNHLWSYTTRVVDSCTFTITFKTKDGYHSEEEARRHQQEDERIYEKEIKRIKSLTNIKYTFTEFVEYWFDMIYNTTPSNTSAKVICIYTIQNLIFPNVTHDVLLSYVTANYLNDIIEKCMKISQSSGQCSRKFLHLIFTDAKIYGYIEKNLGDNLMKVPELKNRMILPDQNALKKLLATAKKHPAYYLEILLALFAGLQQGEILGLKYSDFDRETQTLRIERQWTRSYLVTKGKDGEYHSSSEMVTSEPKSSSYRTLKIPAFLFDELETKKKYNAELLKKAKSRGVKKLPYEYISISTFGIRKTTSSLTPALKKISSEAGIPAVRMHMLRHCFGTLMIESGVPLEQISHCMGHASVLTTFNTYCGVCEGMKQMRELLEYTCPAAPNLDKEVLSYV